MRPGITKLSTPLKKLELLTIQMGLYQSVWGELALGKFRRSPSQRKEVVWYINSLLKALISSSNSDLEYVNNHCENYERQHCLPWS